MTAVPEHFARPVEFGLPESDDERCAVCGERIYLHTNPDGRRIWRHLVQIRDGRLTGGAK